MGVSSGNSPANGASTQARLARASLLALDPDLGRGLDAALTQRAQALTVHVARVPAGDWSPALAGGPGALGVLIVDGLVVRETACAESLSAELLGPGDVVRPWSQGDGSLVASATAWFVPEGARIAILDARLTAGLAQWPSIATELFARAERRAHTQSVLRATSQLRRLDHRTLLYLWQVGERLGRVTPAGVALRLPLTHERIAALVGAHRPSFTTALSKLERAGLLQRGDDYELVLTAAAREAVADLAATEPALAA